MYRRPAPSPRMQPGGGAGTRNAMIEEPLGGFHNYLKPELTLEEVGSLLGISDNKAMMVERSATQKLRGLFSELGLRRHWDLLDVEDRRLRSVPRADEAGAGEYNPRSGWFRINSAKSLNDGTESLNTLVPLDDVAAVRQHDPHSIGAGQGGQQLVPHEESFVVRIVLPVGVLQGF